MKMESAEPEILTPEQELNLIRYQRALNRRNFLKVAGIGGTALAGAVMLGCGSSSIATASAAGPSEADVLNFALNLEYLEANFYVVATTGSPLGAADTGGGPAATGGGKVPFADSMLADIAAEIAADELAHVRFLRTALGSGAVAQPNINLNALGIGFKADADFLTLARAFEDTGVSAYAGAATLLTGNNLQAAAQILATEALHTGNLRLKVVQAGISAPPLDALDKPPSESQFFNTDKDGLAIKRTPSQVLAIVYANSAAGTKSGGFYPNGVNGAINTV